VKLTMRKSEHLPDWYLIERAEHDGRMWEEQTGPHSSALMYSSRFSTNADVEGASYEMLAIADAIEQRGEASFRRCEVIIEGEHALFCSPRNSREPGRVTLAEADALAAEIRRYFENAKTKEQS
jgi:hypothetical protein